MVVMDGKPILRIGDLVFFFNDTATTEIYTLSLHDALPIFTDEASRFVAEQGDGLLHVFVPHATAGVAIIETGGGVRGGDGIGRAHIWNPVTEQNRMPASALQKKIQKIRRHNRVFRNSVTRR